MPIRVAVLNESSARIASLGAVLDLGHTVSLVGYLERRRRAAHAGSMNWDLMATVMVTGHELGLAEEAGLVGDAQSERAFLVRDAVLDRIGSDHFARTLTDTDFDMPGADKDDVVDAALERSGYNAARRELFPES